MRRAAIIGIMAIAALAGCEDEMLITEPAISGESTIRSVLDPLFGSTYVVTNTDDAGEGSLRAAIEAVDANQFDYDSIHFRVDPTDVGNECNVVAGATVCTIHLESGLPPAWSAIIDGTTQFGYVDRPLIEVAGIDTQSTTHLGICLIKNGVFNGPGGALRGLIVNGVTRPVDAGCAGVGTGADDFVIEKNWIGINAAGDAVVGAPLPGNVHGVFLSQANGAIVRDNVIAMGENGSAVFFNGDLQGVMVTGNKIGVDPSGQDYLPNHSGVSAAGYGHLIKDNVIAGIGGLINLGTNGFGANGSVVQGNNLGTNADATMVLPSPTVLAETGIFVPGTDNLIGGDAPEDANVVVAGFGGIFQGPWFDTGSERNVVKGNYFGLNRAGVPLRPAGHFGWAWGIDGGHDNTIQNNRIASYFYGIRIRGPLAPPSESLRVPTDNRIIGNRIEASQHEGILVTETTNANYIGGTDPADGNTIVQNGGSAGIAVAGDGGLIIIRGNSIHDNHGLGIDLGQDGPTENDLLDDDTGPNGLQNAPALTAVYTGGDMVTAVGSLHSTPNTEFTLDFYSNAAADPSGHGEGDVFVGSALRTTDASGNAEFVFSFPTAVALGDQVSSTATGPEGTSEFSAVVEVVANPDDEGPLTIDVVASSNPVPVGSSLVLDANVDDTATGSSAIASAEFSLDGQSTWTPMDAEDGMFDGVVEAVTATTQPTQAAVLEVCVRGTDALGNTGPVECLFIAVFDPDGGFVSGAGWINSPQGAFVADPSLTGKATFGFVSRYEKGRSIPSGNTQFRFRAADLDFRSSSYEWLVINRNDGNAQYKGWGTINGAPAPTGEPYRFMLWAGDKDPDTLRIRIWYENGTEEVVYDNATEQEIGGGSIVIHQ